MRKVEIVCVPNDNKLEMHFDVKLITDEPAAKEGPDSMRLTASKNNIQMKPAIGNKHLPHLSENEMQLISNNIRCIYNLVENKRAILWLNNLD